MNKKNTFIKFITALIFTLFTVALFLFFIHVIKNKNLHISNTLFTLHQKEDQDKNALVLRQRLKEVEDIQNNINSHFVDRKKPDNFVFFLEDLGNSSSTSVDVKSIDISKKEKNIMNASIVIEGSFSNVLKTIALLENSPYKIEIQSINLDSREKITITEDEKEVKSLSWTAGVLFTTIINE